MKGLWMVALATGIAGCTAPEPHDLGELVFVDDCTEAANDDVAHLAGLDAVDDLRIEGVQLCAGDVDAYRIDIPPGMWASVEMVIDGTGRGPTDLDLWEVDGSGEVAWYSATEEPYERLAWVNPGRWPVDRYLLVDGYQGAAADYTLEVKVSEYHRGLDCDAFYPDEAPGSQQGPCNEIMQFPAAEGPRAGYFVQHDAHYSNLRREVTYLVRYAARETRDAFEDTNPIALLDMSERDGSTPGTMVGQLRHPAGTHVEGNDIDVAYYQNGPDNGGRPVCPQNDGYFCTGPATRLDARRTAFFLAKLFESDHTRVIGVDPAVAAAVGPAAWGLVDEGLLEAQGARDVNSWQLAHGSGWPFHHHHLHFSWQWEGGVEYRGARPAEGCLAGPELNPR